MLSFCQFGLIPNWAELLLVLKVNPFTAPACKISSPSMLCVIHIQVRKRKQKGLKASHFTLLLVVFNWHLGSEGVKQPLLDMVSYGVGRLYKVSYGVGRLYKVSYGVGRLYKVSYGVGRLSRSVTVWADSTRSITVWAALEVRFTSICTLSRLVNCFLVVRLWIACCSSFGLALSLSPTVWPVPVPAAPTAVGPASLMPL